MSEDPQVQALRAEVERLNGVLSSERVILTRLQNRFQEKLEEIAELRACLHDFIKKDR